MLINELFGKTSNSIIRETDSNIVDITLDTMIVSIKSSLESGNRSFTLDEIFQELNKNTGTLYIDSRDENRRNYVMEKLKSHGLSVDRGSGQISLAMDNDATNGAQNDAATERQQRTAKVSSQAMNNVRNNSSDAGES
jgi:hypothetical protein